MRLVGRQEIEKIRVFFVFSVGLDGDVGGEESDGPVDPRLEPHLTTIILYKANL